jgi:hypothetical protein
MIGSKRCDTCRECGWNVLEGGGDGNSKKVLVGEWGEKTKFEKRKTEKAPAADGGRYKGKTKNQSQKRREVPPLRKPTAQQEVGLLACSERDDNF